MQAYGAAKAGLVGLTHAQAVTLANKVRVNAVLPGWIYTEKNPDELTKQDHEWHPSGKQLWILSALHVASVTLSRVQGVWGNPMMWLSFAYF